MSAVSASGVNLYQFFQSISQSSSTQAPPPAPTVSTDGTTEGQADGTTPVQGGHHHHHGGHGKEFAKIQSAVTSALQSRQNDPTADPNQTIQDAIESVLNGDNTDPSAADANADGDTIASLSVQDPTSNAPGSSQEAFGQLLQSVGVDPQQFHQDFLKAIQDAQNGNPDPSTALQSLPPGSVVDTQA